MKSIRINIEGLQEIETQDKVRDQLESVIGVQNVGMSAGQTYVDVDYDEQTSDIELNNHLQNNGYKITDRIIEIR
ncbi:hypothetical protein [[Clostridium] fimetarium]|uniref:Uncharacterized protein n=1 Tax=[Clostridium] fimetarium TaxID=99656 RepID=A0A1I0QAJ7_9FIRM|nr:hypothetical protein [[Clostridium] fimetarium]SEW24054.1 hypothetical protein SAMN05421659_107141 [[Clostridium] fimetarium]